MKGESRVSAQAMVLEFGMGVDVHGLDWNRYLAANGIKPGAPDGFRDNLPAEIHS